MSLDDVVTVTIVVQSSALTLPGFGVPLLLGPVHSNFAGRIRFYTSDQGLLDDGFTTSDAVHRMAVIIFSQNPRPTKIAVGRRIAAVAQVDTLRVAGSTDGDFDVTINGQTATFTAASSTATAIRDGLVTAINALSVLLGESDVVAAPVGTIDLSLTASTAGIQFSASLLAPVTGELVFLQNVDASGAGADGNYTVQIGVVPFTFAAVGNTATEIRDGLITLINAATGTTGVTAAPTGTDIDLTSTAQFVLTLASPGSVMSSALRTLNGGIPEDLSAISDENEDWYMLLLSDRDDQSILSAARSIETQRRTFLAQSSDAQIVDTPFDAVTPPDIASKLKALSFARTAVAFATNDTNDVAAAWAGIQLPKTPASSTWKFKTLVGVLVDAFTATQLVNIKAKDANGYREIAGRNITFEGTVAQGEFLDVIRGIDKLFQDIQANVFGTLLKNDKIPFTNSGIQLIAADVRAALQTSLSAGLIAESRPNALTGEEESPAFTVAPPNVADIPAADRENRIIPATNPIVFEGTLAGAIHAVNVSGTLSV